jgi:hypothetical protein
MNYLFEGLYYPVKIMPKVACESKFWRIFNEANEGSTLENIDQSP